MKKINIYFIAIFFLITACDDQFFETSPATQITTEEVFASEDHIDAFINGALRYLFEHSTSQDNPGLPTIFLTHEVMGEDAFARDGRYGYRDSYPYRDPYDNTTRRALFFWTIQYTSIDHANNIIAHIDLDDSSSQRLRHLKGQAHALRAFNYLNLVRQYQFTYTKNPDAKAIPIYTEPTTPDTYPLPLSTVREVYDLVLEDLTIAEKLLPGYERPVKNRLDLNVVYGLLARTYLTLEDWERAADYAQKARQGYPIMSAEQYTQGFNDVSNEEWIWGHPQTPTQNKEGASFLAYLETTPYTTDAEGVPLYYGYNSIMPDPHFIRLFEEDDIRKSLFEIADHPADVLYAHYRYKKFRNKHPNRDGHIILMRASEPLLIQAESEARQGKVSAAINTLNELRQNRNLSPLEHANFDSSSALNEILLERRKELWGEGFRLYDLLRLETAPVRLESKEKFIDTEGRSVTVRGHWITRFPDGSDLSPNSHYFLFPIPLNEFNNNPNLQ